MSHSHVSPNDCGAPSTNRDNTVFLYAGSGSYNYSMAWIVSPQDRSEPDARFCLNLHIAYDHGAWREEDRGVNLGRLSVEFEDGSHHSSGSVAVAFLRVTRARSTCVSDDCRMSIRATDVTKYSPASGTCPNSSSKKPFRDLCSP